MGRLVSILLLLAATSQAALADTTIAVIHSEAATPAEWREALRTVGAIDANDLVDPEFQIVALGGGSVQHLDWLAKLSDSANDQVHLLVSEADLLLADKHPEVRAFISASPFVLQLGDWAFAYGGISGKYENESVQELNQRIGIEITGYPRRVLELRSDGLLLSGESITQAEERLQRSAFKGKQKKQLAEVGEMMVASGRAPHQYRGSAICHPYAESFNVERFLKRTGARHLVVSTNDRKGMLRRMDGMVYAIGLTQSPDVLLLRNDVAQRASGKSFDPDRRLISEQLSEMSDSEVERFLRKGEILRVEEIGTGITNPLRITQQLDGITQDSVFKYVDSSPGLESKTRYAKRSEDSDRYIYEVVAYKLDRLLDLQMIPVAVQAEVNDKPGVLQDWITGAINERDRGESGQPFESACPQYEQYRLRFVFDLLIHNEDRNLTNILWDKEEYRLLFIDHTRAFRVTENRPDMYRSVELRVSDLLRKKLMSLSKANLSQTLAPYLHPRQIEAILIRRDQILEDALTTDL